ncbi:MAG: FMN-binding protein [Bacillota bacterium]|nr:FMN-binding protein [Bacillota bacterium]
MSVTIRIIALIALIAALIAAAAGLRTTVYTDGSYQAVSQANDKGYTWAQVTLRRDKITAVELKEFDGKAAEKDFATYPWAQARQANEVMPGRFVEKNTWDVDIVAEATSSSNKYREAVKFALEKARRKAAVTTTHFDGTFLGRTVAGPRGYGLAWVTVQNDNITDVLLKETDQTGEFKDFATYAWAPARAAFEQMAERLKVAAPADVPNVDIVAGATTSSQQWKDSVHNALTNARIR